MPGNRERQRKKQPVYKVLIVLKRFFNNIFLRIKQVIGIEVDDYCYLMNATSFCLDSALLKTVAAVCIRNISFNYSFDSNQSVLRKRLTFKTVKLIELCYETRNNCFPHIVQRLPLRSKYYRNARLTWSGCQFLLLFEISKEMQITLVTVGKFDRGASGRKRRDLTITCHAKV